MKDSSNKLLMSGLFWFFRIGFWLHLIYTITLFISLYTPDYSTRWGICGEIHTYESPFNKKGNLNSVDVVYRDTSEKNINMHSEGLNRVIIKYKNIDQLITMHNIYLMLLDFLSLFAWPLVTLQLFLIISSFRKLKIFEKANISRLRFIAIVFTLIPILKYYRNFIFWIELTLKINVPGKELGMIKEVGFVSGICTTLLLLVLIEIFKYGFQLKQENDLTI